MAIRDCSNLPDDHPAVPEWVVRHRERAREIRRRYPITRGTENVVHRSYEHEDDERKLQTVLSRGLEVRNLGLPYP